MSQQFNNTTLGRLHGAPFTGPPPRPAFSPPARAPESQQQQAAEQLRQQQAAQQQQLLQLQEQQRLQQQQEQRRLQEQEEQRAREEEERVRREQELRAREEADRVRREQELRAREEAEKRARERQEQQERENQRLAAEIELRTRLEQQQRNVAEKAKELETRTRITAQQTEANAQADQLAQQLQALNLAADKSPQATAPAAQSHRLVPILPANTSSSDESPNTTFASTQSGNRTLQDTTIEEENPLKVNTVEQADLIGLVPSPIRHLRSPPQSPDNSTDEVFAQNQSIFSSFLGQGNQSVGQGEDINMSNERIMEVMNEQSRENGFFNTMCALSETHPAMMIKDDMTPETVATRKKIKEVSFHGKKIETSIIFSKNEIGIQDIEQLYGMIGFLLHKVEDLNQKAFLLDCVDALHRLSEKTESRKLRSGRRAWDKANRNIIDSIEKECNILAEDKIGNKRYTISD